MSLYKQILIATILTITTHTHAQTCLNILPPTLITTLEQDHWHIIHTEDLAPEDIPVWKNHHPGSCPGIARGNFHHNSNPTYVIALIQKSESNTINEKVVVVTLKKKKTITEIAIEPTPIPTPAVVWSLPSRRYLGVDGAKVFIPQDSFAYERLVGTSRQYFFAGHRLKYLQMSY